MHSLELVAFYLTNSYSYENIAQIYFNTLGCDKKGEVKRNEHLVFMCGPFKLMVSSSIANLVNDIIDNNIKITIVFLKN